MIILNTYQSMSVNNYITSNPVQALVTTIGQKKEMGISYSSRVW